MFDKFELFINCIFNNIFSFIITCNYIQLILLVYALCSMYAQAWGRALLGPYDAINFCMLLCTQTAISLSPCPERTLT